METRTRPGGARAWIHALALLVFVALGATALRASASVRGAERGPSTPNDEDREYHIKAAFLLNFVRYTTWPSEVFPDASSPIRLLVVGVDPFDSILEETFKGEKVNGRAIVVARSPSVPDEIDAQAVFCGALESDQRAALLARCASSPVLLIGEHEGFAEDGACVNFYISEKKTRFEVNTTALAAGRMALSPAVLKLARIVKTRRNP